MSFISSIEGDYHLSILLEDIPILMNYSETYIFTLSIPPAELPLDTSTTTVTGGSIILLVVGLAARRKLKSVLEVIPSEWEG
jgi:hypothetical protein